MLSPVLSLPFLLAFYDAGEPTLPCADSSGYAAEADFWAETSEGWEAGTPSRDACDPEEDLLFPRTGTTRPENLREKNRASFAVARNAGGRAQSVVRQQAQRAEWSHRLELRGDTLTRRRLAWTGAGWKLAAGDLDDPEFPIWHDLLPRRTLPLGWRTPRHPPPALQGLTSTRPQGAAA